MSTVLENKPVAQDNLAEKLNFSKNLQAVTNKIHATSNIDEIMLELSQDICALLNADRLTLYLVSEDKTSIVSKVKTGLNSFKDLKLPIAEHSIAGFVAVHKKMINIRDVYDEKELKTYSPHLNFLKQVDTKTGYRTKQMLVAPVLDAQTKDLIGVVQIINSKAGQPFPPMIEEGATHVCETLAIAYKQRQKPTLAIKGKYDNLVTNAVISAEELDLATRSSRRKNLDIETVLIDEFQVKVQAIGEALAAYFGVPYEPFKSDRVKPMDLLKNMSREFIETSMWVPIDETQADGIIVLTTDPEKIRGSKIVNNVYPKSKIAYRVCCGREFMSTLDGFFGASGTSASGMPADDNTDIGDLLSGMEDDESVENEEDVASAASDNEVVKLVNKIIVDAYKQGASDIHIEPYPGKAKTEIRFRKDGSLMNYISVPAAYRNAIAARLKIMCDLDISERRKPQDGKIKFKKFGPLDIELRVATIPSQGGVEDIVMRILAAGEPIPEAMLASLGCVQESVFKRGMKAVFRMELYDMTTGKRVTPLDGAIVKVKLPTGDEIPLDFGRALEGLLAWEPRQIDAGLSFQHPHDRKRHRHQRRLRVLGQGQIRIGPLEHQAREVLAERLVDLLEDLAGAPERRRQIAAHADRLRPLARKNERIRHGNDSPDFRREGPTAAARGTAARAPSARPSPVKDGGQS